MIWQGNMKARRPILSDVKWIKIVTDIFDDEKILLIEALPERDSIIVIWFKLLCLAGKNNNGGVFLLNDRIPYTEEMLSTIFRRPINVLRLAIKTFEQFGMIEVINDTITIPNWEKHQSLDVLERAREQTRKRVAACRERKRLKLTQEGNNQDCNATVTDSVTLLYGNVTQTDKNREEGEEENKIKKKSASTSRFVPPSVAEVREYCQERRNNVDAQRFCDYYESNGWKVGKNPMKDWRAAVRTWERNNSSGRSTGTPSADAYDTGRLLDLLDEES